MMPKKDESIEYKKSTGKLKEGVYSICAMLNRNGSGALYFGINKDGEIVGQQVNSDVIKEVTKEIKEHIVPPISPSVESVSVENKNVLKITFSGDEQPYSAYYRYMIRNGDEDVIMTNEQLARIFEQKRNENWESLSSGESMDSIDEETVDEYIRRFNELDRLGQRFEKKEDLLKGLNLLTSNGKLNNAGYYLFTDERPIRLRLVSDDGYIEQHDGNILECIEYAMTFVEDNIDDTFPGEDMTDAVKEIVVNSIVHRDFASGIPNTIEFKRDSLRVTNSGSMPEGRSPIMFAAGNGVSLPRNPTIANALYADGTMDSLGSGFRKVYERFKNTDIECSFTNDASFFKFEFRKKEKIIEETNLEELSREENIVYGELKDDGRITVSEICAKRNLTVGVANRVIRDLRNKGYIRREGSNKTGTWIVSKR